MRNHILSLLLITAMVLGASGQVYKLETSGNQFVVTDESRSATVFRYPASGVRFRETGSSSVQFYDENKQTLGLSVLYSVSNTVDEDSEVFSSYAALITFLDRNTGGLILGTTLTQTLSADSITTGVQIRGEYSYGATGDYGSGSLAVQLSMDNSNWTTYSTFSSDTLYNVKCGNCYLRYNLSSSTDPDLDTFLSKIE